MREWLESLALLGLCIIAVLFQPWVALLDKLERWRAR
jgi:hypothetical protein